MEEVEGGLEKGNFLVQMEELPLERLGVDAVLVERR